MKNILNTDLSEQVTVVTGAGRLAEIVKEYLAFGGTVVTMEPHLAVFGGLAELEQSGSTSEVGGYRFADNNTAFDAACEAFKNLL